MAIRVYKPTHNSRRNYSTLDNREVFTRNRPEKSLTITLKKHGGRNNTGSITTRHQGGGVKQRYRIVDFLRIRDDIPATVASIEYDPNRSANIALINYQDGVKAYILAPEGIEVGQKIQSGTKDVPIKVGNCLPIGIIPEGQFVHNVELTPKQGGKLARSAGNSVQILGHDDDHKYTTIRLASGEMRKILSECRATIGVIGNKDHATISQGKAGRNRWRGIRPTVRGSAMNPNDHPHGGGEGKSPIGRPSPMTPWGKKAYGIKTRNPKKPSNKFIIRHRKGR